MITESQAQVILTLLSVEYPENYRNLSSTERQLHIARLCKNYEEFDFSQVYAAYEACIRKCKFAPKTADVFEFLRSQTLSEKLEPAEARAALIKAARNGTYGYAEEYKKLPDELKEIVTEYHIREMAALDTEGLTFYLNSILKQLAENQRIDADFELLSPKGKIEFSNHSMATLEATNQITE